MFESFDLRKFTIDSQVAQPIIQSPYICIYSLDLSFFQPLQKLCFEIIQNSLTLNGIDPNINHVEKILDQISNTDIFKINKDLNQFCNIENLLKKFFNYSNIDSFINLLEFPTNLRAIQYKAPKSYLDGQYPTDKFHSDIWAGEPEDTLQGFIYIGGNIKEIYMKLYKVTKKNLKYLKSNTIPYNEMSKIKSHFEELKYSPQEGMLILFDAIVPHHTFRSGQGSRISLDFRFKKNLYSLREELQQIELDRIKKYWLYNKKFYKNYHDKLEDSLKENYQIFWYKERILEFIRK